MNITRKKHLSKGWFTGLVLGVASSAVLVYAATISVPHTFTAGDIISAQEMNENFEAITTSIDDKAVTVNCGTDTIGDALAAATPGGAVVITVNGTCPENVSITRDDVTLLGGAAGAIVGEVLIDGARRAVIDGLNVSGAGAGIRVISNGAVTVQNNSIIENNAGSGVDVGNGGFALVDGSTIQNNGVCEIIAFDGGVVRLVNNIITSSNPDAGNCSAIGAFRGRIRMAGGNTVTNTTPTGFAIDIFNHGTLRQSGGHDTVFATATAVEAGRQSYADLRDVDITGPVEVFSNSLLHLRDAGTIPGNVTVTGDINIFSTAVGNFSGSAIVTGDVNCFGSAEALGLPTFGGVTNC